MAAKKELEFEWLGRNWLAYVCDENDDVIRAWNISVEPDGRFVAALGIDELKPQDWFVTFRDAVHFCNTIEANQ